jgi:hypothetical protein
VQAGTASGTPKPAPAGSTALNGVGTDTAGQLLVTAGDNPHRLHNDAAFSRPCGATPIPRQQRPIISGRRTPS